MKLYLQNLLTNDTRIFYFLIFTFCCSITTQAQNADEPAIRTLLANQTKAWNKGNIDDFMKGYWQNDSLVFIGKKGPNYGYLTALNNYKKNYPDTATMGRLQFNLVQIKKLSPDYYSVVGQWKLQRSIGNVEGFFTLLLRKINNAWVIVMDHTS